MLAALRERCPTLQPAVVPAGHADAEQGVALLGLCADATERQGLATFLRSARATRKACALTSRPVPSEADLRFISRWEVDPAAGTYSLHRCAFVCAEAALLLDTAAMLERFSRADADAKELGRLAQIFSAANQPAGEEPRGALEARLELQECLNLAAACQVVASSLSHRWRVLGPDGQPLGGRRAKAIAEAALKAGAADGAADEEEAPPKKKKGKVAKSPKRAAVEEEDVDEDAEDDKPPATKVKTTPRSGGGGVKKTKKRVRSE